MGLSLEEVAAAAGIMADAGIKGSQAGTTLRGALTRLTKPTSAMQEVMDNLNLSFYDGSGQMKSLTDITAMLQTAFAGLTDEQEQNALTTLFGTESLSGMLALIQAGPDELQSLTESFENSDGAAAEMAATMQDNLKGSFEQLSGSIETAGIEIADLSKGKIRDLVDKAGELVDKFNELNDAQQDQILTIAGVAVAAGPALTVTGKLSTGLGTLIEKGLAAKTALGEGKGLSGALTALIGPGGKLLLAAAAAAAFVAAVEAMGSAIEPGTKAVRDLIDSSEELRESTQSSIAETESNAAAAGKLADALAELDAKTVLTTNDKAKMRLLVEQLNKLYPDLNLQLDEESGHLQESTSSIKDYISAQKDKIKLNIYEEQYTELVKKQVELEDELKKKEEEAVARKEKLGEKVGLLTSGLMGYALAGTKTQEDINALNAELEENQKAQDEINNKYNESMAAMGLYSDTAQETADSVSSSNNQMSTSAADTADDTEAALKAQQEAYNEFFTNVRDASSAYYDDLEKQAQDNLSAMGGIADESIELSGLTAEKAKENLEQQIVSYQNWREQIAEISKRVPEDVAEGLEALGPTYRDMLEELNGMTDDELASWVATWQEKTGLANDTAQEQVGSTSNYIIEKLQEIYGNTDEYSTDTYEAFAQALSGMDADTQAIMSNVLAVFGEQLGLTSSTTAETAINIKSDWQAGLAGMYSDTNSNMSSTAQAAASQFASIKADAQAAMRDISAYTDTGTSAVKQSTESNLTAAANSVSSKTAQMATDADTAFGSMSDTASSGSSDVASTVNSGYSAALSNASTQMNLMIQEAKADWREVWQAADKYMGYTEVAVSGSMGRAADAFSVATSEMVSSARTAASRVQNAMSFSLWDEGYNAASGFASGLSSQAWRIQSIANNIAWSVRSTIRSALDIHSPSRALREDGQNAGEGFALGLEDMQARVEEAADTLASMTLQDDLQHHRTILNQAGSASGSSQTYQTYQINFKLDGSVPQDNYSIKKLAQQLQAEIARGQRAKGVAYSG
jgi:hypothetical protein